MRIAYPSKAFVRRAQATVRKGERLEIAICGLPRQKIFTSLLPALVEDGNTPSKNEPSPTWLYVSSLFLFARFFAVHFYALAANCRVSAGCDDEFVVTYIPAAQVDLP
jgi:hypothetical protein